MKKIWLTVFTVVICACTSSGSLASIDSYGQDNYMQSRNQIDYRDNYVPPLPAYNIGDYGPAGGIIFYDKRSNIGGWRYLEAALEDAEFQAAWSKNRTYVGNTKTVIGNGKQNTQLIANRFLQTGEGAGTAVQIVLGLEYGGFNDWFLPSQAELDQLYGNLKRKNIGDLKDELYWASDDANKDGKTSVIDFRDGTVSYSEKENIHYVRPVRQVPGPHPAGNNVVAYTLPGKTSGLSDSFFSRSNIVYTILGVLIVGGLVAYMIWGPTIAGSN